MRVALDHGDLEAFAADGVAQFRGIPFAAPPLGERRFLPPQPVEPWTGVRDATQWGPRAPQSNEATPFRLNPRLLSVTDRPRPRRKRATAA